MAWEELIREYGYLAILVVTFFEGETIVILAGVAAAAGHLSAPYVIGAALAGSISGDQLWFHLGRRYGPPLLARRAGWRSRAERLFFLLQRNERWLILTFRFYYGLRAVAPFVIGAARIAPFRFLRLNVAGAIVWACTFTALGYVIGDAFASLSARFGRYGAFAAIAVTVAAVLVLVLGSRRAGRRARKTVPEDATGAGGGRGSE